MGDRDRRSGARAGNRCRAPSTPRPTAGPGRWWSRLPEDMLTERVDARRRAALRAGRDLAGAGPRWRSSQKLLAGAQRADRDPRRQPLVAGGVRPGAAFRAKASRCRCAPRSAARMCSTRCIPATPAISASAPIRNCIARIKIADLVVLVGGRMGEMPSQSYTLFDIPRPQTTFVHVHPGAEELGRVYSPHLAINATPTGFCRRARTAQPPKTPRRGRGGARRLPRLDRQGDRRSPATSISAR